MGETSVVGMILALIGIFKGKDIWEFFKHRATIKSKTNDKVIEIYEKQLNTCETKVQLLETKNEKLSKRFETKLKSRGKTKDEPLENKKE